MLRTEKRELFFVVLFEWIEFVGVSFETVAVGDGIEKEEDFERSESNVGAKEDEGGEAGEVCDIEGERWELDDFGESKLAEADGDEEHADIYREDGFFAEGAVSVKDGGNDDDGDNERSEFGEEIVGILAVHCAID